MTKQEIIQEIKNKLSAHSLTIGEDTFQSCPIHNQISENEVILIETIYIDGVSCTHYINNIEMKTYFVQFEEITQNNLELILENVLEANSFLEI